MTAIRASDAAAREPAAAVRAVTPELFRPLVQVGHGPVTLDGRQAIRAFPDVWAASKARGYRSPIYYSPLQMAQIVELLAPDPQVSVVDLLNEAGTIDEPLPAPALQLEASRATVRADLRRRRLDRRHVRRVERLHKGGPAGPRRALQAELRPAPGDARRPRARARRHRRDHGRRPAERPEDIPRLIEAVEAGSDVASGRRAARQDSWGRTLPSRLINGMLRRFTRVGSPTSAARSTPTGAPRSSRCSARSASRSSRRRSCCPAARASSRSTSPTRRARVAVLAAAPDAAGPARARRLLAAADPVDRDPARATCSLRSRSDLGATVDRRAPNFPGLARRRRAPSSWGSRGSSSRSSASTWVGIQREVEGRPLYTIERELAGGGEPSVSRGEGVARKRAWSWASLRAGGRARSPARRDPPWATRSHAGSPGASTAAKSHGEPEAAADLGEFEGHGVVGKVPSATPTL